MIKVVGVISQFIIAICALCLSLIASQEQIAKWWGIRALSGNFHISIFESEKKVHLVVSVRNFGLASQYIQRIESDKDIIQMLSGTDGCSGFIVKPRSLASFDIRMGKVEKLKNADSLFLAHNMARIKIASKDHIQSVLKSYEEYIKKGWEYFVDDQKYETIPLCSE